MLDYLNEQDDLEPKNDKPSPAAPKDTPPKVSKLGENEFVVVQASGKNTRKTTILLAILFAAGMAGLFYMVKKGAPQIASAQSNDLEQVQVDMLVSKLGGVRSDMSSKMEIIVKKFYDFANVKQVGLDQLLKNPFLQGKKRTTVSDEGSKVLATTRKSTDFQLFSIMRGDTDPNKWCCMVNDKLLYRGQIISDYTVAEIEANFVVLKLGENKITLKLAEE